MPLEPLGPRIRNVSSRHIEVTWSPPSNAKSLGQGKCENNVLTESRKDSPLRWTISIFPKRSQSWFVLPDILQNKVWVLIKFCRKTGNSCHKWLVWMPDFVFTLSDVYCTVVYVCRNRDITTQADKICIALLSLCGQIFASHAKFNYSKL